MNEYQVNATSFRDCILVKDGQELGKLDYNKWFSFDAMLMLADGKNYHVTPKGLWGTTIELKEGETTLLNFKMGWNGSIIIHSSLEGPEQDFVFKPKGFLQSSYVLKDKDDNIIIEARPRFDWSKFKYEYKITTADEFESFNQKEALLLIVIHCANYYMSMMAAAV